MLDKNVHYAGVEVLAALVDYHFVSLLAVPRLFVRAVAGQRVVNVRHRGYACLYRYLLALHAEVAAAVVLFVVLLGDDARCAADFRR